MFCPSLPDACTLLQFRFWAASPKQPTIAFSMELLSMLHILTLECAVSIRGFVNAIQWKNKLSTRQVLFILKVLGLMERRVVVTKICNVQFNRCNWAGINCRQAVSVNLLFD